MKILIRRVLEDDHPFIYATYLRNRWFDKTNRTLLKRATWSTLQHKRLEGLIDTTLIACLDGDPDVILGYMFMDNAEPFVYVKLGFRSMNPSVKEALLNKKDIK